MNEETENKQSTISATGDVGLSHRLLSMLLTGTFDCPKSRMRVYLLSIVIGLSLIWGPALTFSKLTKDHFVSKWTLILPGAAAGLAVSLESIGQASATSNSPFNSHSVDPKVNYKALAESRSVLNKAAAIADIDPELFDKPKVKLADQTAMMEFRVVGESAEMAHKKSLALYTALQNELDRLRTDEFSEREVAVTEMLRGFDEKLISAQDDVLSFQAQASIVSLDHFSEISRKLEELRATLGQSKAEQARVRGELEGLQGALGLSTQGAAEFMLLGQDTLYRQLSRDWAQASSVLTQVSARWGKRHEKVVAAKNDERDLRNRMHRRATKIAPSVQGDDKFSLSDGYSEGELYKRIIELTAQLKGYDQEIVMIEQSIEAQKVQIASSAQDASQMENLKRKHQVATAVFTTALAKVDIGKSDRFTSYPMIQLLAEPTIPDQPETLSKTIALLGAAAGSFLLIIGFLLLWHRKRFIQKIQKNV